MRTYNIFGAVSLLAASALGVEEGSDRMPCFNDICWTSWRCWYWKRTNYDAQIGDRCGLPGNVYRPGWDGAQWNTLVWGEDYPMTWTSNYESQDEEIVLEWLMFSAPGSEVPLSEEDKDMGFNYEMYSGYKRAIVAWSQNISALTTAWTFQPRLSDFPNQHLNVSSVEITAYGMERNLFRIYHPKSFNPHDHNTFDISEPFTIIRPAEERMIKRAAYNHDKSGKKKLAIGVSVGVAVAWFVAFLVSWYTSAWYERKQLEKKGLLLKPAQLD